MQYVIAIISGEIGAGHRSKVLAVHDNVGRTVFGIRVGIRLKFVHSVAGRVLAEHDDLSERQMLRVGRRTDGDGDRLLRAFR